MTIQKQINELAYIIKLLQEQVADDEETISRMERKINKMENNIKK